MRIDPMRRDPRRSTVGLRILRSIVFLAAIGSPRLGAAPNLATPPRLKMRLDGPDVVVTWAGSPAPGVARYVIRRMIHPDCPRTPVEGDPIADLAQDATGGEIQLRFRESSRGIPFCYGVFAIDASGAVAASVVSPPLAASTSPPPAPSNLRRADVR